MSQGLLSILANRIGLQTNAQANVPVTPNNGNPAGANNMPQMGEGGGGLPNGGQYAWLRPSPYMDQVQEMLRRRQMQTGGGGQMQRVVPHLQTGGGMQQMPVLPHQPTGPQIPTTPIYGYNTQAVVVPQRNPYADPSEQAR